MNAWIRVCKAIFYCVTAILGRRIFLGGEQLQRPGGILLVGNHISHLDPVYNAVFVRKSGRWPHFMAKSSLWKVPVVGKALTGTQQIPVERNVGAGQEVLAAAIASMEQGKVVVIYPEGTITRDPEFWPMKPKAGVALLALSGDITVLPMATWGTQRVFVPYIKKGKFKPFPRKDITVKIGEPLDLSAYQGKPIDSRAIRDVSFLIMGAVKDLVAELRTEPAPAGFFMPPRPPKPAAKAPVRPLADPGVSDSHQ
ncbi:1-acyl-sn-glycerol-3-phosphate acyltransferase [Nakamurella antarctica]|uniref:1-acyl-sn-glycerol-3-phosphate acyltransferase n=2 Tax=Nakamurella antarctica TaxID=1902245 RepID=A0A3G8ZQX5_9ACTN|nr:1-acyl-sn-glycerol-3-phosphate acyltransferase [Nakamurella antarctica]